MERKYTLKNAFDNRYKNTMIFSLFFIFGLSLIAFVDISRGSSDWTQSVIAAIIAIIFDILITLSCYKRYHHLNKHGTLIHNLPYTVIKDNSGVGIQVKCVVPQKGEITLRYYRYHFEEKEVGSTGFTDILIDMQHPNYYYIFYDQVKK